MGISSSNKNRVTLPGKRRPPARHRQQPETKDGDLNGTCDKDVVDGVIAQEKPPNKELEERLSGENEYDGDEDTESHSTIRRNRRSIKRKVVPKGGVSLFGAADINQEIQGVHLKSDRSTKHSRKCDNLRESQEDIHQPAEHSTEDLKFASNNSESKLNEESNKKAESERKRNEEETKRKVAEEEAKIKAEEEARIKAEEEAKMKAEEEARRKAEEEARKQAEDEARKKEEARKKAELEAKKKAEEEAKRKAEEEERKRAEEEARRKAEEEAKKRAEEEAR